MTDELIPVTCQACGVVDDAATEAVLELQSTILTLGKEVARKQAQIGRLRSVQAAEHPPEYEDAMEVAHYWRERCAPRAKELNGIRLRNTIARLQAGYDKDSLRQSIDGYAARPNIKDGKRVREGGKRFCDLELIMRDEQHVVAGIDIAIEEMRFDQGALNGGGSHHVAALCGCGHARVSHQLYRLMGHDACAEKDCMCQGFDDIPVAADQWLHRQGYYERQRSATRTEASAQARLL